MAESQLEALPKASDEANGSQSTRPANSAPPLQLDDSTAAVCYANFCRVNGAPEELIIDFGLNTQPMGAAAQQLKVTQRVVVNYYTAKRLLAALHVSVQRHEAAFGILETDVQKRVVPGARRGS